MPTRPPLPVLIAIALPLLLAVAVAVIAISARAGLIGAPAPAETGPLAVVPVDAPDAEGTGCTALLAALPSELPAAPDPLPTRELAAPVQPGVRAWAALPRPVVLRCGLPRPAELTPSSALLQIDGVSWLQLDDGTGASVVTYVAVDRPVYVALTVPVDAGSGPLQEVSDTVRAILDETPVAVR